MKLSKLALAGIVAAALPSLALSSTTTTTTFQVTALVSSSCSMTTSTLDFGTYDPLLGSLTPGQTTISVTCNLLTPYTLKLNGGSTNANIAARKMSDGASHTLNYQLYTDTLYTTIFGDGTGGSSSVAGVGTGIAIPTLVYGKMTAGQNVPNGSYADTITISLIF